MFVLSVLHISQTVYADYELKKKKNDVFDLGC